MIAIVGGTGREGRGLATRWARAGRSVVIGSRDAERAVTRAQELNATLEPGLPEIRGADNAAAVTDAEVVVLAIPWGAHQATVKPLAPLLQGKLVIDLTVPLAPPAITTVSLPDGGSVAAHTQAAIGEGAQVVAALHHVSSAHLGQPDRVIDCDVLVCGDDPEARGRAMGLIEDLGLRPVDAGALANAVALEALTPVLLHINRRYGAKGAGLRITGLPEDPR